MPKIDLAAELWTVKHVAAYLQSLDGKARTPASAKLWMWRNGVRRCKANRKWTRPEWVKAVLKK